MNTRILLPWMTILIMAAGSAYGQGFILPRGDLQPPRLTNHRGDVSIRNQISEVKVEQIFKNETKTTVEGVYYFPVPTDASVSNFAMWVDGKKLKGELLDRQQARKIYEEIVRRNIDPALLEYADYQFFRVSIFPIPAGQERKIELDYSQFLDMDNGLVRFLYPLHGESQIGRGVRLSSLQRQTRPWLRFPQQSHDRGESQDLHSRHLQGCQQVISVKIESEVPLKNVYSPSHDVEIDRQSEQEVHLSYEGERKSDEGNFVVYYSVSPEDLGFSLICHRGDDDRFFLLLVSPKTQTSEDEILDKDVIFVLDTSGSMSGEKIGQAKGALEYCINQLRRNDRFAIITFNTVVTKHHEQLVRGHRAKREALEMVRKLKAKGGTDINNALQTALSYKPDRIRPMNVVFLTDGLPTVGVTDVKSILKNIDDTENGMRVFTFGVGYNVNTYLLDKIAEQRRGVSDYIEPDENIEEKISIFYDKVSIPVLSNIAIDFGRARVSDVYPRQLQDVFEGSQLMVVGKYRRPTGTTITLSGTAKDKRKDFVYETEFVDNDDSDFLPRLWASRKIAYLVDQVRADGENDEVRQEIEELSKKYGIMSPYTSFLVEEEEALRVAQSLGGTLGVAGQGAASYDRSSKSEKKAFYYLAAPSAVGRQAVDMSKMMRAMKESERVGSGERDNVRFAGGRTFYFKDGEWVDSMFENDKVIEIKHGSQAYISLLTVYPHVGKFMKLGNRVLFKLNKKFIRISEKGKEKITPDKIKKIFG